jgi:hypothetical protein
MSEHKNISEDSLDLVVDSRPFHAEPGDTVTIPDEFDYQLDSQPAWEPVDDEAKAASAARLAAFEIEEPAEDTEPEKKPTKKDGAKKDANEQAPAATEGNS